MDGLVCIKTIKGSMEGEDFEAFVRDDLCTKLSKGKLVIMDNLNSHKQDMIRQKILGTEAKLLYLPRYFPDFNPIEMLWSVLKAFFRIRDSTSTANLFAALRSILFQKLVYEVLLL